MNSISTKLKTGDEVIVIAGKDIGKKGTLRQILKAKNRGIVTGINMVKKHTRPNPDMGITGGIVEQEASCSTIPPVIPISGLGLVCFFTMLIPVTIPLFFALRICLNVPFLPISFPAITITSSPVFSFVEILFIFTIPQELKIKFSYAFHLLTLLSLVQKPLYQLVL